MSTVVAMNSEEIMRNRFNDIMANARPMMTKGSGKSLHTITAYANVPLALCYVDERYQGMRTHKHIKRLENKWDERKLSNITLVPHPEEYRFAIVDGQGRFLVAPKKGLDKLFATILMDAPENPTERLKFEAEYFIGQDTESENVKPLEKHPARVIIGDESATILDKLLKNMKLSLQLTKEIEKSLFLEAIQIHIQLQKFMEKNAQISFFSIISNAGWNKETNGYATFVMRALRDVWVAHPNNRTEIHEFLSDELRQLDPGLFSANAKSKYPKRDHRVSCVLYAEDMVCKGLGIKKMIYIDGDKKCKIIQ